MTNRGPKVHISSGPFVRALISVDAWPSAAADVLNAGKAIHEMVILYSGDEAVHLSEFVLPHQLRHLTFHSLAPYPQLSMNSKLLSQLSRIHLSGVRLHFTGASDASSESNEPCRLTLRDLEVSWSEVVVKFKHRRVTELDLACTSLDDATLKTALDAWPIESVNVDATHVSPKSVWDMVIDGSIRSVDAAWLGVSSNSVLAMIPNMPKHVKLRL